MFLKGACRNGQVHEKRSGDEIRFVRDAFESNYIAPLGHMVDAFERELAQYTGIKRCLGLSSGHRRARCTAAVPAG